MDFYDSQFWFEERERVLLNWDGHCERCELRTRSPHVHHVYGLDSEVYEILCPDCHSEHHGDDRIRRYKSKKTIWHYKRVHFWVSEHISVTMEIPV